MAKYEPSHLKNMNTKIVFQEFRSNESLFVNKIAQTTRISVPTVMKIVEFLIEKQLIVEQEYTTTKVGRKPNMLKLNRDKYYSVGIIYEGDYLIMGIVDLAGNVLHYVQVRCGHHFESSLFLNIDKLLEMSGKDVNDLIGIGIGIPCIFDAEAREITAPLIGINNPIYFGDTIDRISEKYNAKVIVDNDLNMQAFGEYVSFKPPIKDDLIFISLGTGLGAGVIIDGKVRKGNNNVCGEIGYMVFEYSEEKPNSGWLEEKINLSAIKEKFGIVDASDDENRTDAIAYVSGYLALIVNNMICCYDVSNIVLDGYVIDLLGDGLIKETQRKLDKICFKSVQIRKRNVVFPGVSGGALLAGNTWLEEIFK